jgi:hypothetical protein
MSSPNGSDHEDDAAIEAAVAKDAFGLASFTSSSAGAGGSTKGKASSSKAKDNSKTLAASSIIRKEFVTNPDVLTEVS